VAFYRFEQAKVGGVAHVLCKLLWANNLILFWVKFSENRARLVLDPAGRMLVDGMNIVENQRQDSVYRPGE